MSEEPMMEKSVSVPEAKAMIEKPIPVPERKSIADKMIAVECGASHPGVTKAAEVAPAEVPAKMPPAKAASVAATATVHGGRTQRRAGRDHRHGGQCHRYFPHHDVHSISCEMHPSLCEGQQSPASGSAQRHCSMARLGNPSPKDRSSWEISSASHRGASAQGAEAQIA